MRQYKVDEIAKMIDHTELKATSGKKKIRNLCREADRFGFISVCVNPAHVAYASELLAESDVLVCSVVGFPLGMSTSDIKAKEAEKAVSEGAMEIDMVINVAAMSDGDYEYVLSDIRRVVQASAPAIVKVILETCYLKDEEIVKACELAVEAGAHFVKTSTGFGAFGAFEHHIRLMRRTVGPYIGVKASGGVSTAKDVIRMINAGASRLGTSAGIVILEGIKMFRHVPEAWMQPQIPCHICSVRSANMAKLTKGMYQYYTNMCKQCEYQDKYNKFYE